MRELWEADYKKKNKNTTTKSWAEEGERGAKRTRSVIVI